MKTKERVIECPVCGSNKIEREEKETSLCVPYGTEKKVSETLFRCSECKTSFGDDKSADEDIKRALELLKKDSARNILKYFSENRMNFAGMERALELPQRTMSRWKTEGAVDASALALLRMIRTFPWLIDVADNNYDEVISKRIHILSAITSFYDEFKGEDRVLSALLGFRKEEERMLVSTSIVYNGIVDGAPTTIQTTPVEIGAG